MILLVSMNEGGRVSIRVVSGVSSSCRSRCGHCGVTAASLMSSDVFLFMVSWSSPQFKDLGLQLLPYDNNGCVLVLESLYNIIGVCVLWFNEVYVSTQKSTIHKASCELVLYYS